MSYYDDYDDYIAEDEEKINAIIDEQAIYDIASKKVKEKLDELKQRIGWRMESLIYTNQRTT